jgi:DNA-binding NtrC family response regulator
MLADFPSAATARNGVRPIFTLLEGRLPGSRWDLIHLDDEDRPRFLLGRLNSPHPGLPGLDEESALPPFLLEHPRDGLDPRQLSFDFDLSGAVRRLDWIWPLGRRGRALWICGRLERRHARELAERQAWLASLFGELGPLCGEPLAGSRGEADGARESLGIRYHMDSPVAGLLDQIRRVARSESPVFLQGESGVGKELFARAVHRLSPRRDSNFVAQNGGALTDTLIESELFGHSRGSFTGAREERVGLVEMAAGGTFFLDEVGDLSSMLQVRLLRVLQDKQIRRVGENRLRPVDFRLVTATHRDMEERVRAGSFRLDLWYRIQGVSLRIPPLRERPMDIPVLAAFFLDEGAEQGSFAMRGISEDASRALCAYAWPGNVRELENEIGRILALYGDAERMERWMLSDSLFSGREDPLPASLATLTLQEAQRDLEKRMIRHVLGRYEGNRSRSARALGLSRQGLLKKLKRLGMERVARRPRLVSLEGEKI